MIILAIRTDKPEAEIGLFKDKAELASITWQAHRQLAETVHQKMEAVLKQQKLSWTDIGGIVVYQGPGSFTGLRIGVSVANALAYSLAVPIVGVWGDNWRRQGITQLLGGQDSQIIMPNYGSPVHITLPKK